MPYKAYAKTYVRPEAIQLLAEPILDALTRAADQAAHRAALRVAASARRKAPVRKIFRGGSRRFGYGRSGLRSVGLDALQLAADRRVRQRIGIAPPLTLAPGRRSSQKVVTSPDRINAFRASADLRRVIYVGIGALKEPSGGASMKRVPLTISQALQHVANLEARGIHQENPFRLGHYEGERAVIDTGAERYLTSAGRSYLRRGVGLQPEQQTLGGSLRASIRVEGEEVGTTKVEYSVVAGGPDAPYARFVEFGTRRSVAQPFLRPAIAEERVNKRLVADLAEAINGIGRSR